MEALHKPVLPRAAWFNVNHLDPNLLQPPLHDLSDVLRAVVAAQILWCQGPIMEPVAGYEEQGFFAGLSFQADA